MASPAAPRGPVIQRQGFLKRAPSGKLSAFKKWEKKWCVFAISAKNGPVLDFFDDRTQMEKGPVAGNRIILKQTKQVCAAIQCKMPHTFIIITDGKIISLAAMSDADSSAWISCLRRVLAEHNCLLSSEDHEYEVHRNPQSKRRPPPPSPPPSYDENESSSDVDIGPPVPARINSSPEEEEVVPVIPPPPIPVKPSPVLDREPAKPETEDQLHQLPLPPPVPSTPRPNSLANVHRTVRVSRSGPLPPLPPEAKNEARLENDFAPKKAQGDGAAIKNLLEVLSKCDDKDESYESGNTDAITRAAKSRTLDHISRIPGMEEDVVQESSATRTRQSSTLPTNVDFKDEYFKSESRENVEPKPRLSLGRSISVTPGVKTESDNKTAVPKPAARRTKTVRIEHDFSPARNALSELALPLQENNTSVLENKIDEDDDARYVTAEEMARHVINNRQNEFQPVVPIRQPECIGSVSSAANVESSLNAPPVTKNPSAEDIYENSLTVVEGGVAKARPAALPRRVVAPNIPAHLSKNSSIDADADTYENHLGSFNVGVPTVRVQCSKSRYDPVERAKDNHPESDNSIYDIPRGAVPPASHNRSDFQIDPGKVGNPASFPKVENTAVVSISRERTLSEDSSDNNSFPNHLKEQLLHNETSSSNQLPNGEPPPPYTPARLLTDRHKNMEEITENDGNDDQEDGEPQGSSRMTLSISNNIYGEIYSSTTNSTSAIAAVKQPSVSNNFSSASASLPPEQMSDILYDDALPAVIDFPCTPPGSPPDTSKVLHTSTVGSSEKRYDDKKLKENVVRLEDSFPKMPQRVPSQKRAELECPLVVQPRLRKSFSISPVANERKNKLRVAEDRIMSSEARTHSIEQFEYDHILPIRQSYQPPNDAVFSSSSSSSLEKAAEAPVVQRRQSTGSKSSSSIRRLSMPTALPSAELAVPTSSFGQDNLPTDARPPPQKAKSSKKKPLDGGMLVKEGKIYKAPARESKNQGLPLKQSQMVMLQEEIAHSAGILVTVFRKDVKYAMFVDIMSGVWVAGWNQKERPLIQNIFHIGDKVLTVNRIPITSASQLWKMIKRADSDTKYEFLIRRLPFGKAYHIHKNVDDDSIGLEVREGTAEIIGIVKGGLAASLGLKVNPNKAFGPGQCHWQITEVNHRPLSLISTSSEAQTRLSAAGKDITFVVQPQDFIELLKKQLKSEFGWKDYIVC